MVTDKSHYLQVIDNFPAQCKQAIDLVQGKTITGEIANIVICGMGGSAIGGDILRCLMKDTNMPVFVNRGYELPEFVDAYSLVILLSYSGNTEETLSCLYQAKDKEAHIYAITSGGALAEQCDKVIKIPGGMQPRAALGYLFFPVLGLLGNSGILKSTGEDFQDMLKAITDVEAIKDQAKAIAKKIKEKTALIYASRTMGPVAYRWKTQINENAKQPAFANVFSELNHNEIAGFQFMNRNEYIAILLKDEHEDPRMAKQMNTAKEVIDSRIDVIEVPLNGNVLLTKMFWAIFLGDYVSYYLAMHNRTDPADVEVIEWLKKRLQA